MAKSRLAHGRNGRAVGPAAQAQIFSAIDVAFDASARMFISDSGNNRIRLVESGSIRTIAGTGRAGFAGDGGPAGAAEIHTPQKLAVTPQGEVYFADQSNQDQEDRRQWHHHDRGRQRKAQRLRLRTVTRFSDSRHP